MKAVTFILLLGATSLHAEVRIDDNLVVDGYPTSQPERSNAAPAKPRPITPIPVFSKFQLPAVIQFQEGTLDFRVPSSLLDRETIERQLSEVRMPTCG